MRYGKNNPAPATCTLDGCARPHRARGLCVTHYYAARASGELSTSYAVAGASLCELEGCSGARYSKGRCKRHYDEGRRSGEFTEPCAVEGCALGAVSLGLCASHVQRARRYGLSADDLAALDAVDSCEVCGGPAQHVDHDHHSGDVRGVLCHGCNTALGLLKDDPNRLHALILYLDRYDAAKP